MPPGPAERVLHDLGITDHDHLQLASALDRATSQLILQAATATGQDHSRQAENLRNAAVSADLIDHAIATGEASTLLPPPPSTPRRPRAAGHKPRTLIRAALPANPVAARQARQQLRDALTQHGLSELAPDAELLTSELVANAAEHAGGTQIDLLVREHTTTDGRTSITCEITDQSQYLPKPRPAGEHAERGRGLAIVTALATESGIRGGPKGKTCWFTLTTPADPTPAARKTPPEMEAEPGS